MIKKTTLSAFTITNTPFTSKSDNKNGILVKVNNKEEINILYSQINKIFINKFKLCTLNKLGLIAIPIVSLILLLSFLPLIPSFLLFLFIGIPIFVKVYQFKCYQFNIELHDGSYFTKMFFVKSKHNYISLVREVRNKILKDSHDFDVQSTAIIDFEVVEPTFVYPSFNIA